MFSSTGFPIQDLANWGVPLAEFTPETALRRIPSFTQAQAAAYCETLARRHYENFPVVSFLLPRTLRPHFFALYAYCRWADDLGDEVPEDTLSLRLLNWWESGLNALFDGQMPQHPVFLALTETIREFGIPRSIFADLLTAFRQDRVQKEYTTREELLGYCRCSANPVGRLILYLTQTADEEAFRLSDAICTGLQLANFWQDVARDWYEKQRIYLPKEDRERFGYTDAQFAQNTSTPEFQALLEEEVCWAESFFEAGRPLIWKVPRRFRLEIRLFHDGGRAILNAVRKERFRVWEKRPEVGKTAKLALLFRALTLECLTPLLRFSERR